MGNDLISRSALIKRFEDAQQNMSKSVLEVVFFDAVLGMVDNAPTEDAEPVRHGRWIENIVEDVRANPPYSYKNGYKCSLCGRETRSKNEPYCHCGAKMDLKEG